MRLDGDIRALAGGEAAGPRLVLSLWLSILLLASGGFVRAAPWLWTPRLDVSESYTDNVTLARSGQTESELISEFKPAVTMSRRGKRSRLGLLYRLQGLYFARDQRRNEVYQQLDAEGHMEWKAVGAYLDGQVDLGQQTVDSSRPVALDNLNAAGNRTDILTLSVTPGIRHRLGGGLMSDLSVGHTQTEYGRGRLDSYQERLALSISHRKPSRFDWGLNGLRTQTRYGNGVSAEKFSSYLSASYRLQRSWQIEGRYGYEDISSSIPGDFSAATDNWSLGLAWTPSRHSRFEVDIGERFFGRTYGLHWNRRHERSQWTLSYDEDVETIASTPGLQTPLAAAVNDITTFTTQLYIARRLALSWQRSSRRVNLGLSATAERRTFTGSDGTERVVAGSLQSSWRWQPKTTLHLDAGLTQRMALAGGGRDTLRHIECWVEYRLAPMGRISAKYRNLHRDAASTIQGYEANSLLFALEWAWGPGASLDL